jgi:hypothetical protein
MAGDPDEFLETLTDTALYSIGAVFQDAHPELVEDVVDTAEEIESMGLLEWAGREGVTAESAFETLMTGLALRYYRALTG